MSSAGFGQGPKKETIYEGPSPTTTQGTTYGGFSPTGTVYNGVPPAGTVYRPPAAHPADAAVQAGVHGHRAGNLFFFIAGLSVINTVLALAHVPVAMALGLGITRVFDSLAREGDGVGFVIVINFIVIGVFALIGFFARKGSSAAILIGMVLYAVDMAPLFLFTPVLIISILIHGYFLYALFGAYRASRA